MKCGQTLPQTGLDRCFLQASSQKRVAQVQPSVHVTLTDELVAGKAENEYSQVAVDMPVVAAPAYNAYVFGNSSR